MVGRRILAPEVGVRVPVPQPPKRPATGRFTLYEHDNDCDTCCEGFVSDLRHPCAPRVELACSVQTRTASAGPPVVGPTAARAVTCPPRGGHPLKALLTGLCALVLCATPVAADARTSADLDRQLSRHLARMKKDTTVISFFDKHRWLLGTRASRRRRTSVSERRADTSPQHGRRPHAPNGSSRAAGRRRSAYGSKRSSRVRPRRRSATSSGATASRRSRSRDASPASRRARRTASIAACSRWARTSGSCSATGSPRSCRHAPRTATSSVRDATGARGPASRGADAVPDSCANCEPRHP